MWLQKVNYITLCCAKRHLWQCSGSQSASDRDCLVTVAAIALIVPQTLLIHS